MQLAKVDASARAAGGGAFEDAADVTNLADVAGGHLPHYGATVGKEIHDADARQLDECFADWRMANPEALGELFSDQALTGAQPALEHFGQQRFDDGLPALAMIAA